MVLEPVCCPDCGSENVVKNGKSNEGKQRYLCRYANCRRRSFIRDYSYRGSLPAIKQQIADMAVFTKVWLLIFTNSPTLDDIELIFCGCSQNQ